LLVERAHQVLAQRRLPGLEMMGQAQVEAARAAGLRLELARERRRRVEVTAAERAAVAVDEQLQTPGMDARMTIIRPARNMRRALRR
jgi:hypothetical protein